ncbi:3-dehydroquinate synthase [Paenibacillus sp. FSL R7-0273]|uniref:3-dehydroquinate synthase n=1 Tax=Paenibacillus sp. FSL R7-0273 TaxID=1536772 RepID=UPI0004F5A394|nr:3-dehydroquinate synthase [Paenibacillus sp. FSL R7-0273]AIQ45198.1 3-dehydroquinate synthase [Paenibacillus sp. FSL R7-0273]OMF86180.1 3-dehydroquinate synthase [Paenibacillus sp. FSL R7-0273]
MSQSFQVVLKKTVDHSYQIEIGERLFPSLISDLQQGLVPGASKFAVITDSSVEPLYGRPLLELLLQNGFAAELFSFPAGEKSKTRETKARLEDELLSRSYGRDSCIIAVGGGAVTDLAGFLAGTFGRGVPSLNYATTLLAAADASVGGKTGVNTPVATNLIGVFHQPRKVYIDLAAWCTLPVREFRSGLAETIKHACLADAGFFRYLEEHIGKVVSPDGQLILDPEICEQIALHNCRIKYEVVQQDEHESNLRQILNLGHTAGRALEAVSGYELLHGEAVSVGLVIQARLGVKLGYMTGGEAERVVKLLQQAGLPTELPASITNRMLVDKMYTDKKVRSGRIRFVFQEGIGAMKTFEDGSFSVPVDEETIMALLQELRG